MHCTSRGMSIVFCLMIAGLLSAQPVAAQEGDSDSGSGESSNLFENSGSSDDANGDQTVKINATGMIDLHVKDLDITQVLQLLSIQSQRNIVASRNVAGAISADLYSVDFYEALEAVLSTNGFGFRERGNFIYVYTAEEIRTMEEAERRRIHKVIRLNYLNAADASTFVSPLLSSSGSIAINAEVSAGFEPTIGDGGANSFASSDTLIIRDYEENIEQIQAVLLELDIRPSQVLLEATVLKSDLDEDNAWGVDLTVIADFDFSEVAGAAGGPLGAMLAGAITGSAQAFETTVGDTGTRFGSRVGILTDDVAAFIKALDEVVDTTILSHPKILVLNRQRADLLIGQRLGYISSTATETSTTQTVEFLDVGTQLTVRPFVSDDGFIRLELRPSVSTGTTSVQQGFVIPEEDTQRLTTNVMVRTGQTVVLGGLFKEETVVTRKQVPVLGDIPLVGAAFKGHDDNVNRSEVIFLLTPTVVKDESLYAAGEHAADRMDMAKLGARQGLLPWSRTKLTTAYMNEAMKAAHEGDRERALWAVNLALRLNPRLIRAREMKEKLIGHRDFHLQRSILNEAVNHHIEKQLLAPMSQTPIQEQATPVESVEVSEQVPSVTDVTSEPFDITVMPAEAEQAQGENSTPAEQQAAGSDDPEQSQEADPANSNILDAIDQWLPAEDDSEASDNSAPQSTASADIPASE